jgi:integrase
MGSAGYLRDLTVLQMYSGRRIQEVCSRTTADVEWKRGYAALRVRDSKAKAGVRPVVFTHAAPRAVLKRRTKGKKTGLESFASVDYQTARLQKNGIANPRIFRAGQWEAR